MPKAKAAAPVQHRIRWNDAEKNALYQRMYTILHQVNGYSGISRADLAKRAMKEVLDANRQRNLVATALTEINKAFDAYRLKRDKELASALPTPVIELPKTAPTAISSAMREANRLFANRSEERVESPVAAPNTTAHDIEAAPKFTPAPVAAPAPAASVEADDDITLTDLLVQRAGQFCREVLLNIIEDPHLQKVMLDRARSLALAFLGQEQRHQTGIDASFGGNRMRRGPTVFFVGLNHQNTKLVKENFADRVTAVFMPYEHMNLPRLRELTREADLVVLVKRIGEYRVEQIVRDNNARHIVEKGSWGLLKPAIEAALTKIQKDMPPPGHQQQSAASAAASAH